MDQDLKHRLVGAAVITSLAAIFVPMLFDDPVDQTGKMISDLKIPESPITAFKKDAEQIPGNIDQVYKQTQLMDKTDSITAQNSDSDVVKWFIQVGIFSQKSNAVLLQNKIRSQGFPVTISTVESDNGTLYRVRVGPELDKNRAKIMKLEVDKLNNLKGIMTSVDE